MKQFAKRLAAIFLPLVMLFTLVACGAETPAQILKKSQEKLQSMTSTSYDMLMEMEMSVMGQTIQLNTIMDADVILSPLTMKMVMTMDMGDFGSMDTTMYMQEEDGIYTMYAGMDAGNGMSWYKTQTDVPADIEQYDVTGDMDLFLSSIANFTEGTEEPINGEAATRFDGVLTGDAMKAALEASGALDQFSTSMGLDGSSIDEQLDSLGELPISIWVAQKTYLPLQYKMDMTDMMQQLINGVLENDSSMAGISLEIGTVVVTVTLSNINGVSEIVIPEEALAAQAS